MMKGKKNVFIEAVNRFLEFKAIVALRDGITFIMPMTLIGSIFLLIGQLPIEPFNNFMSGLLGENWTEPLFQVYNSTMGILAVIAVMGIAYIYTKNEGHEPLGGGITALAVFIVTMNQSVVSESGETVTGILPRTWLGGEGMVAAIIIGLIVGAVYSWFLTKKLTIKMPDGVPQVVSDSIAALVPGVCIVLGSMIVYIFFKYLLNTTFVEWIYDMLQTPLQGITDSYIGMAVATALVPFFWWFGVHGSNLVGSVMNPILMANMLENQAILDAGKELTIANGGHIYTYQFPSAFGTIGGSGLTLGLVFLMAFLAKSKQDRTLGRLSVVPGWFNINEPLIYGYPMVMNPLMFVPFIIAPVIVNSIAYFAMSVGLVPLFTGVSAMWATPPIVSGFIMGGWRMAVLQAVCILISAAIYFPFFQKIDSTRFTAEQKVGKKDETIKREEEK